MNSSIVERKHSNQLRKRLAPETKLPMFYFSKFYFFISIHQNKLLEILLNITETAKFTLLTHYIITRQMVRMTDKKIGS